MIRLSNDERAQYVAVLKDEGAPPANARSAPTMMGVAWHAIVSQIRDGQIVVLDEVMTS